MLRLQSSSVFKYRDRVSIITDILAAVRNSPGKGKRKTQIMQSANLNYALTKKYLGYLVNSDFLTVTDRGTYVMTRKGYRFLQLQSIEIKNLRIS